MSPVKSTELAFAQNSPRSTRCTENVHNEENTFLRKTFESPQKTEEELFLSQ